MREARRILRDPQDAQDAAQEAMIRAWRQRASWRDLEAPLAWVSQIARNEALRVLDRRRRTQAREVAIDDDAWEPQGSDELAEMLARLGTEDLLATLRPDERALARLRYVLDMSQPEMARVLATPEGTIKIRLHRLRSRLRTSLAAAGTGA
jgi:RNA polymerase sigma-70 factor (ECF subfamily)